MRLVGPYKRVKWAARRLSLPVSRDALVLEIGGGHDPYPRSNIVVAYLEENTGGQRPLLVDRPVGGTVVTALSEKLARASIMA